MYGKIFSSMFSGSLHGHWQAIVTFQQMIVLADKDGTIEITPSALSATTSIPLDIIEAGIAVLEAPDPASRTPDEEGRRIIRINPDRPWGWHITNYAHYRGIRTAEERREYHKNYWHNRKKASQPDSTGTQQIQPIAEAEVYAEAEVKALPVVTPVLPVTVVNISDEMTATGPEKEEKQKNNVPYDEIVSIYHAELPELPKVVKLTTQRRGYIKQRWQEDLPDIQAWTDYFAIVRKSKFLMGRANSSKGRPPFRADLAWLCRPENIVKVIEGKYHAG